MNKRLQKRQKRQVARARSRVRVSEPDVRTPEQIQAAREASRSVTRRGISPHEMYSTPPPTKQQSAEGESETKPELA